MNKEVSHLEAVKPTIAMNEAKQVNQACGAYLRP